MNPSKAPYPGLRSFKRDESDIFFGRDECIDAMLTHLAASRFLAVLGSSGIGKSSLVKTGLLSSLQMGLLSGAGSSWLVVDFQPGQPEGSPLRNLVRRLLEKSEQPATPESITLMYAQFRQEGPRALLKWCHEGNLPENTNLLLLVDQFEELFRYQDYSGREEAEAFVALLLESRKPLGAKSVQAAELPIYITLTMRSEFLGACSLIQHLPEAITEGAFLTPRMTREQYREAIVGPAAVFGIGIQETLITYVLNDLAAFAPWDETDVKEQISADKTGDAEAQDQLVRLARRADQLPVLQHTLNRIWRKAYERNADEQKNSLRGAPESIELTLADYRAAGGLEDALNAHADAVLKRVERSVGRDLERTAEHVFRALVTGSTPSNAVRRPTRLKNLIDITKDEEGVRAIIEAFRAPECNFLMPEQSVQLMPETLIDISHESLIRQWAKLRIWLGNEYDAARHFRTIETHAELHRRGKSALLGMPLLGYEWEWWQKEQPNAAWAQRYGDSFSLTEDYLKQSHGAETRRVEADAAARHKSIWRARLVAGTMAVLCLVAGISAIVAQFASKKLETFAVFSLEASDSLCDLVLANPKIVENIKSVTPNTITAEGTSEEVKATPEGTAVKALTRALTSMIKISPHRAAPYYCRGLVLFFGQAKNDANVDAALGDIDEAIRLEQDKATKGGYENARGIIKRGALRFEDAIKDFNEAIELDPPNFAKYAYERGFARRGKGDFDAAIEDYNAAMQSDKPENAEKYIYAIGQTYAALKKYDKAIAEYDEVLKKELGVTPMRAQAYRSRGYARFYLGNFKEAADDLRRANFIEPYGYSMLWEYLATRRLSDDKSVTVTDKAASENLTKNANKLVNLNKAYWPYQVIALYLGQWKQSDVEDAANDRTKKCEASFYIGQWHRLNNNFTEARAGFEAALKICPKDFIEYVGAEVELTRLPDK